MIPRDEEHRGPLAWFVHNKVAANLLMILLLAGGAITMLRMNQEVFPEIDTGLITVQVPYLGGTPADVEEGVVKKIEEEVSGIDGIKRVRSTSVEGLGTVTIELEDYADSRLVLDDVKTAVARIDTFPRQTDPPVIQERTNRVQVVSLVVYGDVGERTLKEIAERMRDDLTKLDPKDLPPPIPEGWLEETIHARTGWVPRVPRSAASQSISVVEIQGAREYEVAVEISERTLREYGLSLGQVADAIAASSLDLPGGSVKTDGGQILIRTKTQRYTGREFDDVILLSDPDGTVIRLSDVARVVDGFEDTDVASYFDGKRAMALNIYRVGKQSALGVADSVKRYVTGQRDLLPDGVEVATWFDRSVFLQQRIDLLTRNAAIGLVLVFLCLMLFLDLRLAFWTTMGIPISFMGAFWLLPLFGVSINMISLFAFIVVLGIVVDDAIVVGENIFAHRQRGDDPMTAAIRGVREMASPVTFAIATTVVAFLPLAVTSGEIGKIMKVIPVVVIAVLLLSLVEALLILPAHLSGEGEGPNRRTGPLGFVQKKLKHGLHWLIHNTYVPVVRFAVRYRYLTLAACLALLVSTMAFVAGGHIKFRFFPKIDADNILAVLEMPQGTPIDRTTEVTRQIEAAVEELRAHYDGDLEPGETPLIRHVNTTLSEQPFGRLVRGEGSSGVLLGGGNSHIAEVNVELTPGESRAVSATDFANRWRKTVGQVPGVNSLVFSSELMSAGEPIHIELAAGADDERSFERLLSAVEALKAKLGDYAGTLDIDDSFDTGKREIKLSLKDAGRNLGLTEADLGTQVRQAFYGAEVQRIQRGRDDIKVMVRYPEDERRSVANLQAMRVRLPSGIEVPFNTVAEMDLGRGYATISRASKRRVVSVYADVDPSITSANDINLQLEQEVLPAIMADHPGVTWRFEGAQAEQADSMGSLGINFAVAMFMIYALLGIQFRSYLQPAIVMSAIPFGLVGAVGGHVLLGFDLSFLSGFGIVALTGVVVNDSLIMIDVINRLRGEGRSLKIIITEAGIKRFRPILLTTLTTFCGLMPMLLETSIQARFLIPMAISLAFGVVFATVITLLLVPTLYVILEDIKRLALFGRPADVDTVDHEAEAEWKGATPPPLPRDPDEPIVDSDRPVSTGI